MPKILRGHLCPRHFLCLSRVLYLVQPGSELGKHALSSAGFVEDVRTRSSMEARSVLESGEEDEQQPPNSKQHPLVRCLLFRASSNFKRGLDNCSLQLPQHYNVTENLVLYIL